MYAPAFNEAASKTGARSGLATKHATALKKLVAASVAVLNSCGAKTITLEMIVHDDSIAAKITGKGCAVPTKALVTKLKDLAAKRASSFTIKKTGSSRIIRFDT